MTWFARGDVIIIHLLWFVNILCAVYMVCANSENARLYYLSRYIFESLTGSRVYKKYIVSYFSLKVDYIVYGKSEILEKLLNIYTKQTRG